MAPTVPASPAPLAPSGLNLVGTGLLFDLHVRDHLGARHGVVDEARGQELAALAVLDHLLHQDLAEALGDAAMDLALEPDRVDHRADIVDHGVAIDVDVAGLGIDLDLADMAAVGIGVLLGRRRCAVS